MRILAKVGKYSFLILWFLICCYPLLTVFFGSFKTYEEFNATRGITPPSTWHFENYRIAFTTGNLPQAFINTFILVFCGVCGSVLIGSMVAYVLNRFDFPFKKLVIGAYFLISMVPMVVSQISTFKIITALGFYDRLIAPIVIYLGADVVMIYVYLQMYEKIPVELDKAALLEGASYFQIYRKILFPLLRPATGTVIILKMISIYNDFYIPFLYLPGSEHGTVATALYRFMGPNQTNWQVICALVILSIIPMMIVFLALQKYIYESLTGGVKS
ncbi:carbohydrate ABC transporter permease [Enterococcus canintestini]|uniref:Sugar ABC transporter permease n=1 Tax=Enterococcus canintestini TaxID=317010 RepID=A0A267HR05_9ENTE|nr:carbohydrate ABC transporter permease [Enterococcus canintestini]PAB00791.1 sugar ABC transporter permease [Enterococcus canintestini]